MLIFKKYIVPVLSFILFSSCAARKYSFDYRTFITDDLEENIAGYIGARKDKSREKPKDKITETWIYRARIEEKIVEQNSVTEYKLMNSKSHKQTVDLETRGYYHELYLFQFRTEMEQQYCIFMSASFDPNRNCIGVGPAYIGAVESGKGDSSFVTEWQLKLKKKDGKIRITNAKKDSVVLHFFSDKPMMAYEYPVIRFYQVVQKTRNKIAGLGKYLVYDINKVFNDPDALLFECIAKPKN